MRKLKIAGADFTFPLLPHEKVLDLLLLLDCEGVDIGLFSGRSHLTRESEFHNPTRQARKLKKKLTERGLRAADVYLQMHTDFSRFAINHPEGKRRKIAREAFLKLTDYANELGADHITIVPGMVFKEQRASDSLKRISDELIWRLEKAREAHLIFGIEAHIGSPFQNPTKAKKLVESISGLSLTLDYTHFIYNGYTQEQVNPLVPYASHFHARGARKTRLQASMTDNIIDYKKIVQELNNSQYQGWIGLEYIWIDWEGCNDVDTLSETIRLRDILKKAFAE